MEENEIVKKGNKGKKILLIVLLVLIVIAGGVFAYFKFFRKDNTNYFDIYNATFKTDDGKELTFHVYSDETVSKEAETILRNNCLKICQTSDITGCDSVKNNTGNAMTYSNFLANMSNSMIEFNKYNRQINGLNYNNYLREYAKFDGKIIGIYTYNFNTQYGVYVGNEISNGAKVPYDYYFLVDFNTGRVIQYNEEMNIITHIVYSGEYSNGRTSDETYFAKKDKNSFKYKVYTTEFKYLGDILNTPNDMMDDDGNVYVINDGIISVYDEKGNKVKSLPKVDNITDFIVFHNSCLALIYEKENLYLYDFSDNSRVKLDVKNEGYVDSKTFVDNLYFSLTSDNIKNNEVVINSINRGIIYDYKTKTFKKTTNSVMYSNDKITIELVEYDSKTDEDGNVTKYYYLYSDGKEIKVTNKSPYNYAVLVVGNSNNIYVLDTTTKKIIAYYTSKKEVYLNDDGDGWYEIFENSIYKQLDGKLVIVANKDNGEVLRLSNEKVKGVLTHDNNLYVAYDKKMVRYSDAGKVLDTITYDEMYCEEYSVVGSLYGEIFVRKGNDYYMIDIIETGFKLIKADKTTVYSGGQKTIYGYKIDDKVYVSVDKEFRELEKKPEKEDNNYIIYSYAGGMCGSNVLIDKKTGDMVATNDMIDFIKTSKGYFFSKSECVTDWGTTDIYTSSWKKLGMSLRSDNLMDSNENIYVLNNNAIELRNIDGEIVFKSKAYKGINGGIINDKLLYITSNENSKIYLVILNEKLEEKSKVLITNARYDDYVEYGYENGKIRISFFNEMADTVTFAYDIATKKVSELKSND